ncbi:UNVERIFIED_CONTAM: hypothetical protein B566_EDAN019149 [Ephemera danica]|nr:hypothetical protein B566_EDAN019149 [Ephemera danica]
MLATANVRVSTSRVSRCSTKHGSITFVVLHWRFPRIEPLHHSLRAPRT